MRTESKAAVALTAGTRLRRALLAGLAVIALASCGGGGEDDDADSTCGAPPQITANNPPSVATVGIQYQFVINSEYSCRLPFWPFWLATCVGGGEAVQLPAGAELLEGAIAPESATYTWTPAANQAYTNAEFQFTNGPDLCGRRANLSWTVSVRGIIEISTIPANGATDVALNSMVTATFGEEMDGSTITSRTFRLQDSFGNLYDAVVSSSGRNAVLDPIAALTPFTTYTAVVTPEVRDVAGNAPATTSYAWSFTTRGY